MEIIAHRGNVDKRYVENSLEAILYSLSLDYIDGVELDVRLTKDKKVVVFHNSFFDPIDGRFMFLRNHTYRYLKKFTIGKDPSTHLVTLKKVLKKIKSSKKIFIELKEEGKHYQILARQVYKVIRKFPYLNLYICSFRYELISYFKEHYSMFPTGLLIGYFMNTKRMYNHFDFSLVEYHLINKINHSAYTIFWTVNSKKIVESLKKEVVHLSIITDKPGLFVNKE